MRYYIKHTSKPYSTGYYSYAKNYLKSFSVCKLSDKEKDELLSLTSQHDVDVFLCRVYNLNIEEICEN